MIVISLVKFKMHSMHLFWLCVCFQYNYDILFIYFFLGGGGEWVGLYYTFNMICVKLDALDLYNVHVFEWYQMI